MKVKIDFLTSIDDELYFIENFISSYESTGLIWDGTIVYNEYVSDNDLDENYLNSLVNEGYELFLRNTQISRGVSLNYFPDIVKNGLLPVVPSGRNEPTYIPNMRNAFSGILCGAGDREFSNAMSYPCMFYDKSITENYIDINYMFKCGDKYDISHIQRTDSTTLGVKLQGYASNLHGTNIVEHGIPIIFTDVSGTDILPLPNGIYYTSYADENGNFFYIRFDSTSGTINNGFDLEDYQSVTDGTVQVGDTDTTKVFIIREEYLNDISNSGITIKNISGFENNPNGINKVIDKVNYDFFGDKITIRHNLGDGTYAGGGSMLFTTESYTTPTVGGLITAIKVACNCDWMEAIGRAISTSSGFPIFDSTNGYGYINFEDAVNFKNVNYLSTPVLNATIETALTTSSYEFYWSIVPFATEYEVWFRNSLYRIITGNAVTITFNIEEETYYTKSPKNYFKVRAKKGNIYSEFSNLIEAPKYGSRFLKIKPI